MTSAHAARERDFKRCCLRSGRYDGTNRNHYFQRVRLGAVGRRVMAGLVPAIQVFLAEPH